MTINELKTACYELANEETARAVAANIACELSNGVSNHYTLSHKRVWKATYDRLSDTAAAEEAVKKAAEPLTLAEVCATVEREENFALAALFVSIWLFSCWLDLLLWIAPRAIQSGRAARQWAIALANTYTRVSYRVIHGSEFPNVLPATPQVKEAIARFQGEVMPSFYVDVKAEVIACLEYSREFYLDSALRLLSLLKASGGSARGGELVAA